MQRSLLLAFLCAVALTGCATAGSEMRAKGMTQYDGYTTYRIDEYEDGFNVTCECSARKFGKPNLKTCQNKLRWIAANEGPIQTNTIPEIKDNEIQIQEYPRRYILTAEIYFNEKTQ
jgi:hypothetical protein